VPDYAEPLCGWRAWLLVEREQGLRLRSVFYPTLWQPRQALQAECLDTRGKGIHVAPAASCRCGIYVACQPARAADFLVRRRHSEERVVDAVLGRAFVWGEVVECEAGWRAGRAYPAHLYLLSGAGRDSSSAETAAQALAAYGVPIELLDARSKEEAFTAVENAQRPLPAARRLRDRLLFWRR
jgi:hypothetical protein